MRRRPRATPSQAGPPAASRKNDGRRVWGSRLREGRGGGWSRRGELGRLFLLRLVRVGGLVALVDALLELLRGLTHRAGELRESRAAKEHQDDHEDDDQLGRAQGHAMCPFPFGTQKRG